MKINVPKARQIRIVERPMRVYHGYAFPTKMRIEIRSNQSPVEYLGTLVHELMHLCFPDLCESKVDQISRVITYQLWRQGYRRQPGRQRGKRP